MTTHNERLAEIEVLFRAGNDRMASWPENRERMQRGETLPFFCECGLMGCRKNVWLTGPQSEAVRADARRVRIAPGHGMLEAEDIIERQDGYCVVQKHEDVRDLVDEPPPSATLVAWSYPTRAERGLAGT